MSTIAKEKNMPNDALLCIVKGMWNREPTTPFKVSPIAIRKCPRVMMTMQSFQESPMV